MIDPASSAAAWLLGRLRSDAEDGLWAGLKRIVVGDPMTLQLEQITEKAMRAAVLSSPGGDRLDASEVEQVVAVLDQLWPGTPIDVPPGSTLLGRLLDLACVAMSAAILEVEGLSGEYASTSSLVVLQESLSLALDPGAFATELAFHWQLETRMAAVQNSALAPLASEINSELGQLDASERHRVTLDALGGLATAAEVRHGFGGVVQRLDSMEGTLHDAVGAGSSEALDAELKRIMRMVQDGKLFKEAGIQLQVLAYQRSPEQS